MTRIVFLDRGTIGPTVELRRPAGSHEWIEHDRTAPGEVEERLAGATVAITNKVPIRGDALARLPDLKMIAVAATGYDCVDVAACRERGIVVANVRGYAVNTVPEHTFALIFALRRSIVAYRADVIAGRWQEAGQFCFFDHPIEDLSGQTLGIVGRGALGRAVAAIGQAIGMRPVFAGRKGVARPEPPLVAFDEAIETADVITLHLPLTPESRDLIAMPEFRRMKRRPLLVNTARGGLVNERDVVAALDEGLVGGIGFDVLTREPPPDDHPLLAVAGRPNVILTPHVAWASTAAMRALWDQLVGNIEAFLAGEPRNDVA
jgi:glycerate dehydrogenase